MGPVILKLQFPDKIYWSRTGEQAAISNTDQNLARSQQGTNVYFQCEFSVEYCMFKGPLIHGATDSI